MGAVPGSRIYAEHNPLYAPGVCGCRECHEKVKALRCAALAPDGQRCGDYGGHRGSHTKLIATVFL
jgi:hypothetical protein